MSPVSSVFFLALLASASPLAAQGNGELAAPGARLRVWPVGGGRPTIGTLRRLDSNVIAVATRSGDLLLSRDSVVRVDVSRGIHSNALHGLALGSIIGGAAGAAFGLLLGAATEDQDVSGVEVGVAGAAAGGVAGGLTGLGIGALSRSERWEKANLAARPLSVHVVPRQGRMVVVLGMRF